MNYSSSNVDKVIRQYKYHLLNNIENGERSLDFFSFYMKGMRSGDFQKIGSLIKYIHDLDIPIVYYKDKNKDTAKKSSWPGDPNDIPSIR